MHSQALNVSPTRCFKDHRVDLEMPLPYDQGQCSCCWSIATAGCVECSFKIAHKITTLHLSPQQLIDCNEPDDKEKYDCLGCFPYRYEHSFKYVCQVGLKEECDYPFVGRRGQCKDFRQGEKCFKIAGYNFLEKDEQTLIDMLDQQPIAAAVRYGENFKTLKEEIYMGPEPDEGERRHSVLIVGYQSQFCDGFIKNYWLIKNSWGAEWGVNGYGKICRDSSLPKGVKSLITRPVIPILHPRVDGDA